MRQGFVYSLDVKFLNQPLPLNSFVFSAEIILFCVRLCSKQPPIWPQLIPCATFSNSPARSPMTTQGAIVLPVVTRGMMEASAIRRLSIP
jgi:hypothetical protein